MSTITKERAQQIFLGNGPEPTASEERELARIALASIEAEPVGYIDAEYTDLIKSAHIESCSVYSEPGEGFIALYAAPPAPVSVPDAMEMDDDFDSAFEHGKAVGWNAYRAAMLQSFGNSEQLNSPVIPDGWVACSERMPETMVSVLVTGTWFHHAVAFWDGLSWCDLDFEPPVTHWMPLPAAPQKEVRP